MVNPIVVCLGPPKSGKTVFSYLLFKQLRELGNDSCIIEADFYSPTLRRAGRKNMLSAEEEEFALFPITTHKKNYSPEKYAQLMDLFVGFVDQQINPLTERI